MMKVVLEKNQHESINSFPLFNQKYDLEKIGLKLVGFGVFGNDQVQYATIQQMV